MSSREQPRWPFSLLNDDQLSNKGEGVQHQPVLMLMSKNLKMGARNLRVESLQIWIPSMCWDQGWGFHSRLESCDAISGVDDIRVLNLERRTCVAAGNKNAPNLQNRIMWYIPIGSMWLVYFLMHLTTKKWIPMDPKLLSKTISFLFGTPYSIFCFFFKISFLTLSGKVLLEPNNN